MALYPRWAETDEAAPPRPFHDRFDAGRVLARHLSTYANRSDAIVLGLPRGGVAVAYEVARALNLPLDVFIVRKLGVPGQEELAMGAIASGGVRVLNHAVINALGLNQVDLDAVIRTEEQELRRREEQFRGQRPPPDLNGKMPRSYTCFYEKLGRACQDAGIKHVSAHSFRHSYRAWLDELGTPISVQQRAMRHGDIRVTMNVYGDPVNDALRDASSKVAERAISQLLTKSVS